MKQGETLEEKYIAALFIGKRRQIGGYMDTAPL
jgi:hypothetical protein